MGFLDNSHCPTSNVLDINLRKIGCKNIYFGVFRNNDFYIDNKLFATHKYDFDKKNPRKNWDNDYTIMWEERTIYKT